MLVRRSRIVLICVLAAATGPAIAQNAPLTFESFLDGTLLTNQYPGAVFSNAIVLSSGISLDEFETPPHGGTNVASDNAGPMSVTFPSAVRAFGGYFTYGVPLTLTALDASNNVLASATSKSSDNEGASGVSGSQPNERIQVSSPSGIYKVVIAGGSQGSSFTLDDATVITRCDLNQDGYINVTDSQAIVNEALGVAQAADDLNRDGTVSVIDIQIVINAALGYSCTVS